VAVQGETYNLTTVLHPGGAMQHAINRPNATHTMKFQPDAVSGPTITGYGPGWVSVNGEKYTGSLVVSLTAGGSAWSCKSFDDLAAHHFEQLIALEPELIIFGSGERIRFPKPQWLEALYARRIGVETMDTQAACRTFNFLAGENRKVVAALLL
jgi:uncharacterized protein